MGRIRNTLALAAVGAALASQTATAQSPTTQAGSLPGASPAPTSSTTAPAVTEQDVIVAPAPPVPAPPKPAPPLNEEDAKVVPPPPDAGTPEPDAPVPVPAPGQLPDISDVPTVPSIVCGTSAPPAPAFLLPIYEAASDRYGLGPQGPAILAAINSIETNFGELNGVTSYAGAVGWMQFMPATWEAYGVDANGDGKADPYDPQDAIFAAANYLSASGMPQDTYNAIFAYNHADWYVADVLARAGCYGSLGDGSFSLLPQLPVYACEPAPAWRKDVPKPYLAAFERAAARYDLDRRGVWALAAIARLESDFGRGMNKKQLRTSGPLGLDRMEWKRFAVDGNKDGRVRRAGIEDSAATLARMIWSRETLRAGIFTHNQAVWYVDLVLDEAGRLSGECQMTTVDWPLSLPQVTASGVNWENVTLSNELEQRDIDTGAIDPRIIGLIGAISQQHTITISSLRSDHSMLTVNGGVSNHYYGRAMDIAAVDGVSCTDVSVSSPCSVLGRTLTLLPVGARPTELIWCFDLDGAGPAFADPGHCDHIHAGYDG